MSRNVVTLEIDSEWEPLLRDHAAFLDEMKELGKAAPVGEVLAIGEEAVIERGRDHQGRIPEQASLARVASPPKLTAERPLATLLGYNRGP